MVAGMLHPVGRAASCSIHPVKTIYLIGSFDPCGEFILLPIPHSHPALSFHSAQSSCSAHPFCSGRSFFSPPPHDFRHYVQTDDVEAQKMALFDTHK